MPFAAKVFNFLHVCVCVLFFSPYSFMLGTKFKCSCVNLGATLVQHTHTHIRTRICKFAHTGIQNQQQQQLVNFAAKQQTRKPAPALCSPRLAGSQSNPSKLHLLAEASGPFVLPPRLSSRTPPLPSPLLLLTKLNLICFARRSRTHMETALKLRP